MKYAETAQTIITCCGGWNNIVSITHCTTRLRFFIHDFSQVQKEALKKLPGVIGVITINDELQIVLGKNLLPIYNEVSHLQGVSTQGHPAQPTPDTKKSQQKWFNIVISFVSAAVTPMIPGLVAGGMLKVFLLLITLAWKPFASSQTYALLGMVANIPFYFMPVFVAYGAAKKLGATPIFAMVATAGLIYPDFIKLMAGGKGVTLFILPVLKVNYSSTLLPALLISISAYYCEKYLVKLLPSIIRPVLVGMGTIIISYTLGLTILGPLGDLVGSYLVNIFLWPAQHFGGVTVGFLAACMPWLVMTGMHHAVTPFMVQAIANPGYDILFRPAYLLHNMAEGGACLGVGLRTKNKSFKAECFSVAFGCIIAGVSEPAIYGVNLRLKRPMYGVMAGGAAGGIIAGILGATAYVYGYSTLLAIPIFQDTILAILAGIIVTITVATLVTFFLGFDESLLTEQDSSQQIQDQPGPAPLPAAVSGLTQSPLAAQGKSPAPTAAGKVWAPSLPNATEPSTPVQVLAPVAGELIALESVQDPTFAQGILGPGCGLTAARGKVVAPFKGKVTMVAETKHAIGLTSTTGLELLLHIGIDTVKLQGQGFDCLVTEGEEVASGQPLLHFAQDNLIQAGYDPTVVLILTNSQDYEIIQIKPAGPVKEGQPLFSAIRKLQKD